MRFRAGDRVLVRSQEEILASLDESGELGRMPFMAEMLKHCGREFTVSAVAHKTCDTIKMSGGRRVEDAVHLEGVRCDGSAHGGCQAACLIFWKNDWLEPAGAAVNAPESRPAKLTAQALATTGLRMEQGEPVYSCQATRLLDASTPLPWWDVRQYVRDVSCGNVGLRRALKVGVLRVAFQLRKLPFGYRAALWIYDRLHRWLVGTPSPYPIGLIPARQPTPNEVLDLKPGDTVQVRPHDEIRKTITELNVNRGMRFDPEMVRFCGGRYRVQRRVERLIDERTGRMLKMKSPCIVLEGAVCSGDYSEDRVFCPRAIQPYFREIWLRRVERDDSDRISIGASGASQ